MSQSREAARIPIRPWVIVVFWMFPSAAIGADFEEALVAAEQGDPKAQLYVGLAYFFGEHEGGGTVPQSYERALDWLRKSANNGNSYAQFHLGGMHEQGIGVEKDSKKGAAYFLESAKRGNTKGRTNIAAMYYEGIGVEQNFMEAYAWATLAKYKGNENAKRIVASVVPLLEDRAEADQLAVQYFEKYGADDDPYDE